MTSHTTIPVCVPSHNVLPTRHAGSCRLDYVHKIGQKNHVMRPHLKWSLIRKHDFLRYWNLPPNKMLTFSTSDRSVLQVHHRRSEPIPTRTSPNNTMLGEISLTAHLNTDCLQVFNEAFTTKKEISVIIYNPVFFLLFKDARQTRSPVQSRPVPSLSALR